MKLVKFFIFLFPLTVFAGIPNTGTASWYGCECSGKLMANGQPFDPAKLTAASWFYPLGTIIRVTNLKNKNFVDCVVTDRGPNKRLVVSKHRICDLSRESFAMLSNLDYGIINVKIQIVNP